MIEIKLSHKPLLSNTVEGYVFLLEENFSFNEDLKQIEKEFYPHLASILEKHDFKGRRGDYFVVTTPAHGTLKQFIFIGLGSLKKAWNENVEDLRRSLGVLVASLKKLCIKDAVLSLPSLQECKLDLPSLFETMAVTIHYADYEFITFKSEKKDKSYVGTLYFIAPHGSEVNLLEAALKKAAIIGEAALWARHCSDLPGNIITPTKLASEARGLADKHGLVCTIFGREKALEMGMGGFAAVDAGSDQDGKFVILEYKTKRADAPTIALVGKGVTFDTGGISLKPWNSMTGMKYDMSGAAAVIAALSIFGQLKPDVNVVGIAPLVENMPSGKATRQDDIVTFMNGKTAEIQNTDAEGRLILADALCYAEKFYKPECIIDIATLTGACVVALGHFFSALMTRDEKLAHNIEASALRSGDRVWRLPLHDDFKAAIKADVADLANTGKPAYGAGTITAGLFLENFVSKSKWAHLDIAGTAHDVPDINYMGRGSSGVGIRLFVDFVMNYRS